MKPAHKASKHAASSHPASSHAAFSAGAPEAGIFAHPAAAAPPQACAPWDSVLAAQASAAGILSFWVDCQARAEIDPQAPLDVLDLAPGLGQNAGRIVPALLDGLERMGMAQPRLRYLCAAPQRAMLATFAGQPQLRHWIDAGILLPTLWDPERGDPCLLAKLGRQPWQPGNPVVVLAQDRWQGLSQRLLAVHYGKLLEVDRARLARQQASACNDSGAESDPAAKPGADVNTENAADGTADNSADKAQDSIWRPLGKLPGAPGAAELLAAYLWHCNSAPIPLPLGAMVALTRIAVLARRGYLVLACAPGLVSERDLRLAQFPALLAAEPERLPVNFHVLGKHLRQLGAANRETRLGEQYALQLALGGMPDQEQRLEPLFAALCASGLEHAQPLIDAMRVLVQGGARSESLLALLRAAAYDPRVFHAAAIARPASLRAMIGKHQEDWSAALVQVERQYLAGAQAFPLHRELAPAAMRAGNWALARRVLQHGIGAHGHSAEDIAHLAWCEMRTGRMDVAERLAQEACRAEPDNAMAQEVRARIAQRLQHWDDGWRQAIAHPVLPLVLEPLDDSHAQAYQHQYRDPQIAVMTGLPPLDSEQAVRDWIAAHRQEEGRQPYALMHEEHGLVGYLCLTVSADEAYFCFWIGADFQGQGFAGESARLLFKHAAQQGVATIFTSVYDDNARSLRTLERVGFQHMTLRSLAPDHDRRYLYLRSAAVPQGNPEAQLVAYYVRENLPIAFDPASYSPAPELIAGMASNSG